jgi:hypothetical protein
LDANHSNICRFDIAVEVDNDLYKFVERNFKWLYREAMKEAAVVSQLEGLKGVELETLQSSKSTPQVETP